MTSRTRTMTAMLLLALGVTACDGNRSPAAPTGAQPPASTAVPPGTTTPPLVTVTGNVVDTAFRPLVGARIEVVEGPQAGLSATSDIDGRFALTGQFDRTTPFRASKDGHVAAMGTLQSSSPAGPPWIIFFLEVAAGTANIAGEYDVTLSADSACSDLPLETLTRSHVATLARRPNSAMPYFANTYFVTVDGASPGIRQSFSPIGVAGDALGFDLSQNHDGRPTFAEQLAPNTYLAFLPTDGLAGTSVSPGRPTFSTTFDGAVEYCVLKSEMEGSYQCTPSQAVTRVRCESHNHRITFTRR